MTVTNTASAKYESSTFVVEEVDDGKWRERAACIGQDQEHFFAEGRGVATQYFYARCACFVCPVRKECLTYAVQNSIYHGIWGGLSYRERLAYCRGERSDAITVVDLYKSSPRKPDTITTIANLVGMSEDEVRVELRKAGK